MAIHRQLLLCIKLRGLREKAGYTQEFTAKALGISQAAYSRMEKGEVEISFSKLVAISELYNVSLVGILADV